MITPPLTLVLAEDHHVVREALRSLLEHELGCRVVGQADNGLDAVALTVRLQPDVLVLDMMMPGLLGLEVIRRVRHQSPGTRMVVLSMYDDEPYVREALRAGASGYVLKKAQVVDLVTAVQRVSAGERYLSPAIAERVLDVYLQHDPEPAQDPYDLLTEREREVLHLAALGQTVAEIAARLVIASRTVETYRASLMRKLSLRHQTDLVRYAIRRGIITLDP